MSKVNDTRPARTPEIDAWIAKSLREQEQRYRRIASAMEHLSPERDQWVRAFLDRIQISGFNVNGDLKRRIRPEEIPTPPARPFKVVF